MSRRSALAVAAAAAFAAVAVAVWALSFRTAHGLAVDTSGLRRLAGWQVHHDELPANLVAYLCNPIPYAILSALVLIAALVTGGRGRALVVAAMLVVPNGVTQVLKDLTAEDRITGPATWAVHVDPASWPSGHATASLALALGAAVASPLAYRWLVAGVGLVFAAAVGLAVILLGWHFPSDVAGGYCVAAAGASLGAAALSRQATTAAPAVRWHPARG